MPHSKETPGLTVFYGPMFSKKTTKFIEAMEEAEKAEEVYQAFKLFIDDRGEGNYKIRSKKNLGGNVWIEIPATPVHQAGDILKALIGGVEVVGIDEAQFFDNSIISVIDEIIDKKRIRVVVSGLPTDFRNEPFGPMPVLIAKADETKQCVAVCQYKENPNLRVCGNKNATRTQRIINGQPAPWDSPVILVGGSESYEARCARHHIVPGKPY